MQIRVNVGNNYICDLRKIFPGLKLHEKDINYVSKQLFST